MSDRLTRLEPEPWDGGSDADLVYVGAVRTPWTERSKCPKNAAESRETGRIVVKERYRPGLASLEGVTHVIVLTWLDRAERDVIALVPPTDEESHGVFATRSPSRPNPIGVAVSEVVEVHEDGLTIRGIDCLDGTPVIDIKPYFASTDARPEAQVAWHARRAKPLPPVG